MEKAKMTLEKLSESTTKRLHETIMADPAVKEAGHPIVVVGAILGALRDILWMDGILLDSINADFRDRNGITTDIQFSEEETMKAEH